MKERLDATKVLRGSSLHDVPVAGGTDLDCFEGKAGGEGQGGRKRSNPRPSPRRLQAKAAGDGQDGRKRSNSRPSPRRLHLVDSDMKMNSQSTSVGSDSQKVAPQDSSPQQPSSGRTTPNVMGTHLGLINPLQQQRSEIFVFSTRLANEAAESVRQGHCNSMIQFHTQHANTRAMLQKKKLKANDMIHGTPPGVLGDMGCQPGPDIMRMMSPTHHTWTAQQPTGNKAVIGPEGMMTNGACHPGSPGPRMMAFWPDQGYGGPHPYAQIGPGGYPLGSMMDIENELMLGAHNSLSASDSLTLEQRQHRSQSLAQLSKIHKMLMGSSSLQEGQQPPLGHNSHHTGPDMYPAMMPSQLHSMMASNDMMSHQHLMSQQNPYGPGDPPGLGHPRMNYKEQIQSPHDWSKAQQVYFVDKQHRMTNRGPHVAEAGLLPPHYTLMSRKHEDGEIPPGANLRMSAPSHGSIDPGLDGDERWGMFGCGPGHMEVEPMPGMMSYHMPPHGGSMDPGFDPPPQLESLPPGVGRGPPQHHSPMHPAHIMDLNGIMPAMKDPHQVTLHRAGNPEKFNPETMGGTIPKIQAPSPPSNAKKRKRRSNVDDSYNKGHLQQTPSPTKIHYHLSQFEGQELMITKQLNAAYVAINEGEDGSTVINGDIACGHGSGGHFTTHTGSPVHGPGSGGQFTTHTGSPVHGPGSGGQFTTHTGSPVHGPGSGGHFTTHTGSPVHGPGSGGHFTTHTGSPIHGPGSGGHFTTHTSSPVHGPGSGGQFTTHTGSPVHGPGSNKFSDPSQTPTHMVSSPTVGLPPDQGSATLHSSHHMLSGQPSGANMRLSHFDPVLFPSGSTSSPHTPTPKSSSMANITSASLADLAKGVENLSNQMQQNMMQGGPFHNIQIQGQITSTNSINNNSNNGSSTTPSSTSTTTSFSPTSVSSSSSQTGTAAAQSTCATSMHISTSLPVPQVRLSDPHPVSTYSNMQSMNSEPVYMPDSGMPHSIGPHMGSRVMGGTPEIMGGGPISEIYNHMVKVQGMVNSVDPVPGHVLNHGPPMSISGPPMLTSDPSMSISGPIMSTSGSTVSTSDPPMSTSGLPMSTSGPPILTSGPPILTPGPPMSTSGQTVSITGPPMLTSGPPLLTSGLPMLTSCHPHQAHSSSSTPTTMSKNQFTSPPLLHPHISSSLHDAAFPPFPTTTSSNFSVQIQQKGHNTIQYLPADSPSMQIPATKQQKDMDNPEPRFSSPLNPMDLKTQSSLLQYFPSSPPTAMRHPQMSAAAAMDLAFDNHSPTVMQHPAMTTRSCSIPDLESHVMHRTGIGMHPASLGSMGSGPMMGAPDRHAIMGNFSHMRPGCSPDTSQLLDQEQTHVHMMMQENSHLSASSPHGSMPPCCGPSPQITPLGPMPPCGGPSPQMTPLRPMPPCRDSSPQMTHLGPMAPSVGASPHLTSMMPILGTSMQGPMPLGGMQGPSIHGPLMLGQTPHGRTMHGQFPHGPPLPGKSSHGPPMFGQSPHGHPLFGQSHQGPQMPGQFPYGPPMSGQFPHGHPMPGQFSHGHPLSGQFPHMSMPYSISGLSSHGPIPGQLAHSSMLGPMPPHGHIGHMHGPSMPSASTVRLPGMGIMGMSGSALQGHFDEDYPGYQHGYFPHDPSRGHPHHMVPEMMGGLPQPYGMISSLQGPG